MKRLIREPLLHFLVLGAALFVLYSGVNRNKAPSRDRIVVTAGQLENFSATFARTWQRPPTAEELKGLVDQYVQEEILSREAIKLGLDKSDSVIRRRLQQKMEFVFEDLAATKPPTEAELAEYFAKHQDQFKSEPQFTFRQVFLNPETRGQKLAADASALLTQVRTPGFSGDLDALGDRLLLSAEFKDAPSRRVQADFGKAFATELATLKTGEWTGPIQSGYGAHLVLLESRTEARVPALGEVRAKVERELISSRRQVANQKFLEGLLAKYEVTIDWPTPESKPVEAKTAMTR